MSRMPRYMLAAAAWCVLAFGILLTLAYYVPAAAWLDAASLHGFVAVGDSDTVANAATVLAHLCNPLPYALAGLTAIAIAYRLRGARTAAGITLLLGGANLTSQLLKPLLAYHRELYYTEFKLNNINNASFPSGHATAAMALSLAVLIIVPRSYRPIAAVIGAAFTIAVTFSILILDWHFPSDVVGGYLIATAYGLATFAALRYANERWPEQGTMRKAAKEAMNAPSPAAIARGTLALAVAAALIAATKAHQIASFADRHTAFVAVASAIAVAAAVLLAAVVAISSTSHHSSS
jgi:membrane-associated phospholipid phosphatase